MTDSKRVTEEWRELRPLLGNFVCHLDSCMKECANIEEVYQKGFDDGKKSPPRCDICFKNEWYRKYAANLRDREMMEMYAALKPDDQIVVYNLVWRLHSMEGKLGLISTVK